MAERITINDVVEDGNGIVSTLNNIKTALVGINGEMQKAAGKKKIEITNKTDADSIANATKALEAMRQATENLSKFTAQVNKDLKEMAAAIKGMPKMPSAPKPSSGGGSGSYGGGRGRGSSNLPLGASDTAELARVDAAIKQVTTDTSKAFPAVNQLQTSFNGLSQIADKLSAALNSMSMQERNTTIAGKSMSEQLKAIRDNMNLTQQAVGKFSLNVGNYQSAIAGVQFSTQQILREVPSAINPQQFFLAISNNIPILMDYAKRYKALQPQIAADVQKVTAALNEAKIAQAAAVAGTKEHEVATQNVAAAQEKLNQLQRAQVPVGRQILKSLVSWQTLLIAGLLLLRKMPEWIKKIREGLHRWAEMLDNTVQRLKIMRESLNNVASAVVKNNTELDLIKEQLGYLVKGTKEWESAILRVNEITGENLDAATATTDEVYETIEAYKKLAIQQAINDEVVQKLAKDTLARQRINALRVASQYEDVPNAPWSPTTGRVSEQEAAAIRNQISVRKKELEDAKAAGKSQEELTKISKDILTLENLLQEAVSGTKVAVESYINQVQTEFQYDKDSPELKSIQELYQLANGIPIALSATATRLLNANNVNNIDLRSVGQGMVGIKTPASEAVQRLAADVIERVLTAKARQMGDLLDESLRNRYTALLNPVNLRTPRTGRTRRAKTEDYGYSDIGDFYWEQQEKYARERPELLRNGESLYGVEGMEKEIEYQKKVELNRVATRKALEEQQNAMNKETESVKYNLGEQLKQIGKYNSDRVTDLENFKDFESQLTEEERKLYATYYEQLTTIERQHQDVLEGIEQEGARKEKEILDARFSWYFKKDVEATEKEMELRKKRQRNRTDEYNNNLITNRNILKLRERLAELEAMDAKGVVEAENTKREAIEKTTEDIKKQAQAYDMHKYINRDVSMWGMLKNSGYNAGINNAKSLMTPAMLKAGIDPTNVTNEQAESWWTSAFDQYTDALKNAKDMTVEYLKEMGDAYVELMERRAEAAREETEEAKTEYEKEKALLEAGYANQVETTWKTYQEKKAIQEQAEQDAKNAQKAMEAVETAQQAVSIATAIAELFKNAASMGPVGVPLAVAASTMLVGSFIAAKAMAAQAANYGDGGFEVLSGGSHASGHDIALGTTNRHGRSMRAEGGEGLGIFSRRAMSRYGAGNIEGVVNAINSGRFGDEAYNSLALGEELGNYAVNGRGEIVNLNRIEKSLANIEKSNENGTFYDKDGNRIEKTPYGTTKYIRK